MLEIIVSPYGAVAITAGLALIGTAISQGLIGKTFINTSNMQPAAHPQLSRASIIALVLAETSTILAATALLIIIFGAAKSTSPYAGLALMGIVGACGLSGLAVSIASYMPASESLWAIARQPFSAPRITNMMLVTMSIIQTPAIFGFLIALLITFNITNELSFNDAWRLCAAGWSIGLGAIGPALGQGIFSRQACRALGVNNRAYRRVLSFALISQTIIETPIIFSLLVSFLILGTNNPSTLKVFMLVTAAGVMGLCSLMPGVSSGRVSATACAQLGDESVNASGVTRTSLIAQGLIDTLAIYGLLISILLIYG